MSNPKQTIHYRVIRGSIRRPRATAKGSGIGTAKDFYLQGDLLPDGLFTPADIRSWLNEGRIESAQVSVDAAQAAGQRIRARGKWRCDPSSLVGKTLEDLHRMIAEIDSAYSLARVPDEVACVRLMTSDWDPRYSEPIAPVSDKSRPTALVAHDIKQGEDGSSVTRSRTIDPSPKADAALAAAKEAAQAPAEAPESGDVNRDLADDEADTQEPEVEQAQAEEALIEDLQQEAAAEPEQPEETVEAPAEEAPEQTAGQKRIAEIRARKAEVTEAAD